MSAARIATLALLLAVGVGVGFTAARVLSPGPENALGDSATGREIAYWVAPMDPNYRRDEPGRSPMGMDLVPVYVGEEPSSIGGEPSIRIDPTVTNNIGVRTALVEQGKFSRRIQTVGFVVPNDDTVGHVHVRSAGWIEELLVRTEGARVDAGDVLFRLYSPDLVNAQAEFLQIKNQSNAALLRAARDRLAALGMNILQIDALAANSEVSQLTDVRAHHPGTVLKLGVREGMYVEPDSMIMDLADLSSVWVMVEVYEDDAAWVETGQSATLRLAFAPGRTWEGVVDYVYPTVDPISRTVRLRLAFDNLDGMLKPNMYAEVAIDAAPISNAVHIPRTALIRTQDSARVILALGDGRFRPAEVVPGLESGDDVEILAGLSAGERLVVSGQFLIDSEASLDAALLRLAQSEKTDTGGKDEGLVVALGRVTALDPKARQVTLDHDPVPELDWPAMTMAFALADELPLEAFQVGSQVRFALRRAESGFEIVAADPTEIAGDQGDVP